MDLVGKALMVALGDFWRKSDSEVQVMMCVVRAQDAMGPYLEWEYYGVYITPDYITVPVGKGFEFETRLSVSFGRPRTLFQGGAPFILDNECEDHIRLIGMDRMKGTVMEFD